MTDDTLLHIRDMIQRDIGNRGLRSDPNENLITSCSNDFADACRSIAQHENPVIGILTGFFIPNAQPPAAETDGPLGALFLARAFIDLGFRVVVLVDEACRTAMAAGLAACGIDKKAPVAVLPNDKNEMESFLGAEWKPWSALTHLIAIERPGPSHHDDKYYNMSGKDITRYNSPAHLLVESTKAITIGIGDGGNEMGMGKIPREVIGRNVKNGDKIACRVPTDYLIVAGVSNWGGYGLAAGVYELVKRIPPPDLFSPDKELQLLQLMVKAGPLVDGVLGKQVASVDGIAFADYAAPISELADIGTSGVERNA